MKAKLTGLQFPGGWGAQWEYIETNKDLARRVFIQLEDKDVLCEAPSREDYEFTRLSADKIRDLLTLELLNVRGGGRLEKSLKTMRDASRAFVRAAGPSSRLFRQDHNHFLGALTAYRDAVGRQLAEISYNFHIEVPDRLRSVIPAQDLGWLPNMDDSPE
ncbi:DUF6650 family protein [Intrasporangium sp. YIM S08009]|uniref:DUF6650 family protein n=1 Tax=Intrasporangium zincisolvens TaxID=3080018 RepID=UPI002B05A660|nr:DUF6650 family protein [Intrasporangium sp. YIM S08009]